MEEARSKEAKDKKKKNWPPTLSDLTWHDFDLISQASSIPEKTWFCYGKAYSKLEYLELVDEDTRPTRLAMALLKYVAYIREEH